MIGDKLTVVGNCKIVFYRVGKCKQMRSICKWRACDKSGKNVGLVFFFFFSRLRPNSWDYIQKLLIVKNGDFILSQVFSWKRPPVCANLDCTQYASKPNEILADLRLILLAKVWTKTSITTSTYVKNLFRCHKTRQKSPKLAKKPQNSPTASFHQIRGFWPQSRHWG